MAPRLSPHTRTSAVTIPRQLAPTVGLSHDGFEFLKGSSEGLKGYVVSRMTKSRRGKLYIDDASWGPEAGSIEYGYRVPFGGIHVFIGKIGEPGPEPDITWGLGRIRTTVTPLDRLKATSIRGQRECCKTTAQT